MDWLNGMNRVTEEIEEMLEGPADYGRLAGLVGCSVYEFFRIFSFLAGVSLGEYLRRRRLSQAAFDLQGGEEPVIQIALKYGYNSPGAFARAFKELHGVTPSQAREGKGTLRTYPPLSFTLKVQGGTAMKFRLETREAFSVMGLAGLDGLEGQDGDLLTPLWREFMEEYNPKLQGHYAAPLWQVGAYQFGCEGGKVRAIIGAECLGDVPEGMAVEKIPAATWAVFSFTSPTGTDFVPDAYTRIETEWFPNSGWKRDEEIPHLEVFPPGDVWGGDYTWEIWMPVVKA